MNELHLFAGAGGGILGGMLLGHTTVCAVEIEPYCRKVLLQRQRDGILPKFPIWDDVCTFDGHPWRGKVDVICGGFPCTDISSARTNSAVNGKQMGLAGQSSGLWYQYQRIIGEVRPKRAFIENSPNLRTKGLVRILQGLASLGYDAKWGVLGSGHIGADHLRKRMWILATDPNQPQCQGGSLSSGVYQEYAHTVSADRRENKPRMERVAHGMAHWMDRLKAIGNGQDPFVAALAWRILTQETI
jgi:DNA (cytosine-5)-methyltransferase 1